MTPQDPSTDFDDLQTEDPAPEHGRAERSLLDIVLWVAIAIAAVGVLVVGVLTVLAVTREDDSAQTTAEMLLEQGMRAVESNPASGTAHIDLGSAYFETGEYEQAATEFEIARQYPETELYATYNLGHVYRLTEEHERAVDTFEQVLSMTALEGLKVPGSLFRDARYWLAVEYAALGQSQNAIDAASPLLETTPLDAEAANVIAAAYADLGEVEKARELFERVLSVQPDDADAQAGLEALE